MFVYDYVMLLPQMKEKYETNVQLRGLNPSTMEIVMNYIYTARLEITKENSNDLLIASDYLQIDSGYFALL